MLLHRFFIKDTSVTGVEEFKPNTGIEVYEVVRVAAGIPLFVEDHLKRFYHSAWLLHLEIPYSPEQIGLLLKELIKVNQVREGNIRFSWCFKPTGRFHAYFIPHFYPGEEMISKGVSCGLCLAERQDPNAKVVQTNLRGKANRMMEEEGYYEVLLVNRDGRITEGSRSNVFFVQDGIFVTAPAEEVLPGITRQKVIELLAGSGYALKELSLSSAELPHVQAAFLTGTSPKILPIRSIGDLTLPVDHPGVAYLQSEYNKLIDRYLADAL